MNELVEKYSAKGLVILAFPCNQFGHQENASGQEILNSLKYVRPGKGYQPKAEMLEKVAVNGSEADPLFVFLKEKLPFPSGKGEEVLMNDPQAIIWRPVLRSDVSWNFEKFLIDSNGVPFKRYSRYFLTSDLSSDIEKLLASK